MLPLDTDAGTLALVGGRLCLDFVNTIDGRTGVRPIEYLHDYADLLIWSRHAGARPRNLLERLADEAATNPVAAQTSFQRALDLRETLYRVFSSIAAGDRPPSEALATFNSALVEALAHVEIMSGDGAFTWGWRDSPGDLNQLLWPVLWSAAEVLTGPDRRRVRECSGTRCDWLFLDTSKNHSRRWCRMETCGNAAKARRHFERVKLQRVHQ
jgi:predicted RNA-binding Zn ribbon-like protein